MIEVYHYNNLNQKLAEFPFVSASETRSINTAYTLRATVLPKTLRNRNISITPFTVFKVNHIFYRQLTFSAEDNERGMISIDAIDLLFADMAESNIPYFNHNTTLQNMLSILLNGTKFTAGACDDLGIRRIDIKNSNKLVILNKILEVFDAELEKNLLEVRIKRKLEYFIDSRPFRLVKGKNILTLEENIDTSTVITKLRYIDSTVEDDIPKIITSPYINHYPIKEEYREFKGNADVQARNYLESCEQPHATYKVTVPLNFKQGFRLGTVTQLLCEQINIDLRLRVVELTIDLTGQTGDSYTLGQKPKSFVEMTVDLFLRDEISEETILELKEELDFGLDEKLELLIPDIVDEIFERLEFPPLPDYLLEEKLRETMADVVREKLSDFDFGFIGGGDGGHIIRDYTPPPEEVATYPEDSIVIVYDPDKGGKLFGKTAFQSAKDGGFNGTESEFNSSLASIGNVSSALEEIIGGEI